MNPWVEIFVLGRGRIDNIVKNALSTLNDFTINQ